MGAPRETNVGVRNGAWGEDVAVEYLRRAGLEIIERNVRPVPNDQRLEIDIIAYDARADVMIFVEVKQHAAHTPWERRIRSVNRRKLANVRRACNAWKWKNAYHGDFRFDVIEIFGAPGRGRPEIDHVQHVNLFVAEDRFVTWN